MKDGSERYELGTTTNCSNRWRRPLVIPWFAFGYIRWEKKKKTNTNHKYILFITPTVIVTMTTAASTATGGCSNSPKIFDLEILQNTTNATRQELMIKGLESSMKSIRSLGDASTRWNGYPPYWIWSPTRIPTTTTTRRPPFGSDGTMCRNLPAPNCQDGVRWGLPARPPWFRRCHRRRIASSFPMMTMWTTSTTTTSTVLRIPIQFLMMMMPVSVVPCVAGPSPGTITNNQAWGRDSSGYLHIFCWDVSPTFSRTTLRHHG